MSVPDDGFVDRVMTGMERRRRRMPLVLAALGLSALVLAGPAAGRAAAAESVVRIGEDATVAGPAQRVVVVGGDLHLLPSADVSGDVTVVFGSLVRDPGARVEGSEYVLDRGAVDWIPGPTWLAVLIVLAVACAYRAAVWWTVVTLAAVLPGTAAYERVASAWERRRTAAIALGLVLTAILASAIGLMAVTVTLLPVALLGLAVVLVAAGAGLAALREGPTWPRRLPRAVPVAYVVLPPVLEIGLLVTAAAGVGAGAVAAASRDGGAA